LDAPRRFNTDLRPPDRDRVHARVHLFFGGLTLNGSINGDAALGCADVATGAPCASFGTNGKMTTTGTAFTNLAGILPYHIGGAATDPATALFLAGQSPSATGGSDVVVGKIQIEITVSKQSYTYRRRTEVLSKHVVSSVGLVTKGTVSEPFVMTSFEQGGFDVGSVVELTTCDNVKTDFWWN
jgi:hypothetical protein